MVSFEISDYYNFQIITDNEQLGFETIFLDLLICLITYQRTNIVFYHQKYNNK